MTLYDFLPRDGSEQTVIDKDYDIETYFYYTENGDKWDNAMMDLAKLLTVSEYDPLMVNDSPVTVDLSGLIDAHIGYLNGLFIEADIDTIMDDMEAILAGNVSEKWLQEFVSILEKPV